MADIVKKFRHELEFEDYTVFKETYVDIDFPIIIRTTGSGIPSLTEISSSAVGSITAPQWQVGDYNIAEGQELIHGWKEGTRLYWHVHVLTNGTDINNRYLRWQIGRVFAPIGGQLSSPEVLTSTDLLIPANTPAKTHFIYSIDSEILTDAKIGTHVWAILKRIDTSNVGTYPAPTNNPWCSMLQIHVQVDTLGSRSIGTKI
jgi:hypothetical protein